MESEMKTEYERLLGSNFLSLQSTLPLHCMLIFFYNVKVVISCFKSCKDGLNFLCQQHYCVLEVGGILTMPITTSKV